MWKTKCSWLLLISSLLYLHSFLYFCVSSDLCSLLVAPFPLFLFLCCSPSLKIVFERNCLPLWNAAFKLLKLRKCLFFLLNPIGFRTAIFHFSDWNLFGDEILFRWKWNFRRVLKETHVEALGLCFSDERNCRFSLQKIPTSLSLFFFFYQ